MSKAKYEALRVLIVDDVAHARMLLRSVLVHLGVRQTMDCAGVEDAFATLCTTPPDLVITDWDMPGGSGLDLIRAIRRDPRSPDPTMPVVLLTAHGSGAQVRQGRDAGATDFLIKPFSTSSIAARLNDVIHHPRGNVVSPGYRGPDRRRGNRPVGFDRRARTPPGNVLVLPPDDLLLARLSGDEAAIAQQTQRRAASVQQVRQVAGAGGKGPAVSPVAVLSSLIAEAIDRTERWPTLASQMRAPLELVLPAQRRDLAPRLQRVAELFHGFVTTPARGGADPKLLRNLLLTMNAILMIGQAQDAEKIAHEMAEEVEALHCV